MNSPPTVVPPTATDGEHGVAIAAAYGTAPYTIQAACAGDPETLKQLCNAGCSAAEDVGHFCLSRRRQNNVASNGLGAAAYWG